jgi:uncharacterized protein YgiM (DUF1202 family)
MKFKYSGLITALVITFATVLPALADTGTIQGVPGSRVNVRQSPSTSARVQHYGLGGDRVNVLNQTNAPDGYRWYLVEFPSSGARGWIRGDLLQVNAAATSQRISFAPGTSAANVGGTSSYLQVQVFDPNGSNLYTGSRNWSGVLRRSGDYRVRVRLVPEEQQSGVTAEYSLTIGIR